MITWSDAEIFSSPKGLILQWTPIRTLSPGLTAPFRLPFATVRQISARTHVFEREHSPPPRQIILVRLPRVATKLSFQTSSQSTQRWMRQIRGQSGAIRSGKTISNRWLKKFQYFFGNFQKWISFSSYFNDLKFRTSSRFSESLTLRLTLKPSKVQGHNTMHCYRLMQLTNPNSIR